MESINLKVERCKQCGLCFANCPNGAIYFSDKLNKAGFNHACVDEEKCVRCGICYTMCPDGVYSIVKTPQAQGDQ
ncbi:MAG: oxidoreductase [Deltaproteobacteria bacterium]|nr:MAG: oxidoreductase [Deltaproteobacteria bacterium]